MMKNSIRIWVMLMLLTLTAISSFGQKMVLDSINIGIEDNMKIKLKIYDYKSLEEIITSDLQSMQTILGSAKDIPGDGPLTISFDPEKKLSVKVGEPGEIFIMENDKPVNYQYNNTCIINSQNYLMQIHFIEPGALLSDDMVDKIREVIQYNDSIQGRLSFSYNYTFHDGELFHEKELDRLIGPMDVLSLKGGTGLNIIRNQPVMDLSAEVALLFAKKATWRNQFYVSYNQLSDFSDASKINLNSFVNLGYRYNLSKTAKEYNWLGVELGYLAVQNGGLFGKNTFRLGVNWEIGKYISISSQLYFSGENAYPALRIGFGL